MSDSYKIYASQDYVDSKGLPDGQGAYQQLVTDAEGNAKWEERTHWKTRKTVNIYENNSAFKGVDGLYLSNNGTMVQNMLSIVSNETVYTIWDGVEYENQTELIDSVIVYGNLSILGIGENTGEPFLYVSVYGFITLQTEAEHNIIVNKIDDVYQQLERNYIPDEAFTQSDWNIEDETNEAYVKNKPIYKGEAMPINTTVEDVNIQSTAYVKVHNYKLVNGEYYSVKGYIKIYDGDKGNNHYVLDGVYLAEEDGIRIDKTLNTAYYGDEIRLMDIFSIDHRYYPGKVSFFGFGDVNYNLEFNLTLYKVKQIDTDCIPSTIQRVGEDIILPSITVGSTKKFKITVDDSGTLTATEVT